MIRDRERLLKETEMSHWAQASDSEQVWACSKAQGDHAYCDLVSFGQNSNAASAFQC